MNEGPPPPSGLHHHAIKVQDLAAAEAFYVGVLGLPVLRRWTYPEGAARDGVRALWLGLEQASAGPADDGQPTDELSSSPFLALERADDPPAVGARPGEVAGHFLFALRIAPSAREAWRRHLHAAGFPVMHETAFTLYVRDPEGNRLGLSHYPAPAAATERTTTAAADGVPSSSGADPGRRG